MNAAQGKKPFYKKTFYLDLKGYRHEAELIKDLKRLGGKQESFLSKEVSFVITSGIQSKNDSLVYPSPNSPGFSAPSPLPFNGSVIRSFDSPPYTSSPVPDENNYQSAPLSRGLSLIQKARQKKQGTTDVLEVCKQWKIKVIPLQKILLWLSKNKNLYNKKDELNKKTKNIENRQKLQKPFLKVEDIHRKFKTRYKCFTSIDETIERDFQRAIRRICGQVKVSKVLNFDSPSLSPVLKEKNQKTKELTKASLFQTPNVCKSPMVSAATVSGQFNINPYVSSSVYLSADKRKKPKESQKENKKRPVKSSQKKQKRRYCEICSNYFTNLEEHLETSSHQKHLNEVSYFNGLQNIVSELPTLEQFLNSTISYDSKSLTENTMSTCEFDENGMPVLLPKEAAFTETDSLNASEEMPILTRKDNQAEAKFSLTSPEICRRCQSDTEVYSIVDEYICGSYSSPEKQSNFPFLEDPDDYKKDILSAFISTPKINLIGISEDQLYDDPVVENQENNPYDLSMNIFPVGESFDANVYECALSQSVDFNGGTVAALQFESYQGGNELMPMALQFEDYQGNELMPMVPLGVADIEMNGQDVSVTHNLVMSNADTRVCEDVDTPISLDPIVLIPDIKNALVNYAQKECPNDNYIEVSYKLESGIGSTNPSANLIDPAQNKINDNTNDNPVMASTVNISEAHVNNMSGVLDDSRNCIFPENVNFNKENYFSSSMNQIQAAPVVKNDCQSDGQDIFSSSSDYNIWESIQSDVNSICKNIDGDESEVLDLSIGKK